MPNSRKCVIDSNVLVLYVACGFDLTMIDRHKRLSEFLKNDYELLKQYLSTFNGLIVTPNVLTETSNLLGHHGEPERTKLFLHFHDIISHNCEIVVESAAASATKEFPKYGLCDSVILEIASPYQQVLTKDHALYGLCNKKVPNSSVFFDHLRPLAGRPRRHR